ncbi:unnamed protein product [Camellia sinensis]
MCNETRQSFLVVSLKFSFALPIMSRKGYLTLFVADNMITMDEFVNRFTKWLDDAKRSMDKEYHSVKSLKDLCQLEMLFCLGDSKRKISYVMVDAEDHLFPTQVHYMVMK